MCFLCVTSSYFKCSSSSKWSSNNNFYVRYENKKNGIIYSIKNCTQVKEGTAYAPFRSTVEKKKKKIKQIEKTRIAETRWDESEWVRERYRAKKTTETTIKKNSQFYCDWSITIILRSFYCHKRGVWETNAFYMRVVVVCFLGSGGDGDGDWLLEFIFLFDGTHQYASINDEIKYMITHRLWTELKVHESFLLSKETTEGEG